jgi:hypothetical protein
MEQEQEQGKILFVVLWLADSHTIQLTVCLYRSSEMA